MRYSKIEKELHNLKKDKLKYKQQIEFWNKIKNDKKILKWAITPTIDKHTKRNTLNGISICESILIDFENIDKNIYYELINLIYSDVNIARITENGNINGDYSFLLMSLWNPNINLSKAQKEFALDEAMNKFGTTKPDELKDKRGNIHGTGSFDIRYLILRNFNWSDEERRYLVYGFWKEQEEYDKALEDWEWAIANDYANYDDNLVEKFEKNNMYDYSFYDIYRIYNNKKTSERIWNEIQFCRLMHTIRPASYERADFNRKQLIKESRNIKMTIY